MESVDSSHLRVFLDTSVVKHSIRKRTLLRPRTQRQVWGGQQVESTVYDFVDEDPTAVVPPGELRTEIDHLPLVAAAAQAGEVELLWHNEAQLEFLGTYLLQGGRPDLLDVRVTYVSGPIEYGRLVTALLPGQESWREMQVRFFRSVTNPRFLELQKACGARRDGGASDNQLVDAWHAWCAEVAGATHFLTTDFKLVRIVRANRRIKVPVRFVRPTELLAEIAARRSASGAGG